MSFKYKMLGRIQSGAALLAVLVVSVVMVMLLGVATTTLQSRLLLAQQSKQKLQDQAQVYGKKNQLVYLIATQRLTAAGISQGVNPQGLLRDDEGHWALPIIGDELRTDGEVSIEESGLRYALQNEAGLIPFNSSSQYWLKRYLQAAGYDVTAQAYLGDTLADYADPDNWRRPGGAEQASYKNQPFSQPANFLLQSCSEMWKVKSWPIMLAQHPDILNLCSLTRTETLNLNAIPIALWKIFWPYSAEKMTTQRQNGQWLLNDADILVVEPSLLLEIEDYFSTMGGNHFQLKITKNAVTTSLRVERGRGELTAFTLRVTGY
jgi:general secretion pathway protein K